MLLYSVALLQLNGASAVQREMILSLSLSVREGLYGNECKTDMFHLATSWIHHLTRFIVWNLQTIHNVNVFKVSYIVSHKACFKTADLRYSLYDTMVLMPNA